MEPHSQAECPYDVGTPRRLSLSLGITVWTVDGHLPRSEAPPHRVGVIPQTRDTVRTWVVDFPTCREMVPPTWDTSQPRLRHPTSEGIMSIQFGTRAKTIPLGWENVARLCRYIIPPPIGLNPEGWYIYSNAKINKMYPPPPLQEREIFTIAVLTIQLKP